MKLASISFYPVKSTAGHEVTEAEVRPWGLAGDRRYLVTDETGTTLTARVVPRLLACVARLDGDGLTLTGPHAEPLRVTPPTREGAPITGLTTVSLHGVPLGLTDCGDAAAAWLTGLAGRPVRLMWLDDPTRRPVNPAYGRPGDRVSLADGYPLLLTSSASLARLDDWIAETALELGEEPRRRCRCAGSGRTWWWPGPGSRSPRTAGSGYASARWTSAWPRAATAAC
ncbi:MOSC domain-containing protein [Nonomuraea antimicrobica]